MTDRERFERFVDKNPSLSGCHLWVGCLKSSGYGDFKLKGKTVRAHRASYIIYKGEIPVGMSILHSCDNPRCVNPDHLSMGSHKENMEDKVKKGRQQKGEKVKTSKLVGADVIIIRALFKDCPYAEVARRFGINQTSVMRILKGITWKHLL